MTRRSHSNGGSKHSDKRGERSDLDVTFHKRSGEIGEDEDFYSVRSQGLCDALATAGRAVFRSLERRYRSDERGYAPNHRENESERNNHECENDQTHDDNDDGDGAGVDGVDLSVHAATITDRGASAADITTTTLHDTTVTSCRKADLLAVQIFGEVYGGRYDHPSVAPVRGLQPVQCGVWYSPQLHFHAFDVLVVESIASSPQVTVGDASPHPTQHDHDRDTGDRQQSPIDSLPPSPTLPSREPLASPTSTTTENMATASLLPSLSLTTTSTGATPTAVTTMRASAARASLTTTHRRRFLNFHDASAVCVSAGLAFVQPLHTGTLASCLDVPIEFESSIPALHGLPSLDTPNLAEGVVIRPLVEPKRAGARGMFKLKIAAFSEKR